jgi:hypothetical protein
MLGWTLACVTETLISLSPNSQNIMVHLFSFNQFHSFPLHQTENYVIESFLGFLSVSTVVPQEG